MRKIAASLCVVLALTLGITLVPALTSAAEFSYDGPPAFTVTYPAGSTNEEKRLTLHRYGEYSIREDFSLTLPLRPFPKVLR